MTPTMVTGHSTCQTEAQTYNSQTDGDVGPHAQLLRGKTGRGRNWGDILHTNGTTGPLVTPILSTLALGTQGVAPNPLSCAVIPPKPVDICCQTEKVSCTLFLKTRSSTSLLDACLVLFVKKSWNVQSNVNPVKKTYGVLYNCMDHDNNLHVE